MSLKEFLDKKNLQDIINHDSNYKVVIVSYSNDTVSKVVETLDKKKIHALPVWDKENNIFLGIVDYLDLVCYLVIKFPQNEVLNDLDKLESIYKEVMSTSASEICNFGGKNPFTPFNNHEKSSIVIEMFAKGIHRIPLSDEKEELTMTISKTAFINFLLPFFEKDEMGKSTVADLGLISYNLVTMKDNDPVVKGFLEIEKKKCYGLPVVDSDGKICGNLSASDIKSFSKDHIPSFSLDVKFWLKTHSEKSLKPITCTKKTSFYEVLKTLVKIHRVWVVDSENKPVGCVSQTDVFKFLKNLL